MVQAGSTAYESKKRACAAPPTKVQEAAKATPVAFMTNWKGWELSCRKAKMEGREKLSGPPKGQNAEPAPCGSERLTSAPCEDLKGCDSPAAEPHANPEVLGGGRHQHLHSKRLDVEDHMLRDALQKADGGLPSGRAGAHKLCHPLE